MDVALDTDQWVVTGPQIIDVEAITALDATVMTGRIDVVAHDDPTRTDARVEVFAVDGQPLNVSLEGGTLRLGYEPGATGWKAFTDRFRAYAGKDAVDVFIALPRAAHVRVRTVRADALIAGAAAGVRVATVSGPVHTAGTAGALVVSTVSGDVAASEHRGRLSMESVSGQLAATGALGEVKVDTVSGSVTLDASWNPALLQVNAVSADVMVRLAEPDAMDCTIRTVSGRLAIDGVEYHAIGGAIRRPPTATPAAPMRVTTVSGNVAVLRRQASDAPGEGGM